MNHLALVMDGNRRWARKRGLKALYGHSRGVETVKKVVEFCITKNIAYLSLYTFSIENFRRQREETVYLFELLVQEIEKGLPEFLKQGIKVCFVGDRLLFPHVVAPTIERVEQETQHGSSLQLSFLFCYGGRQEIVSGVKKIISAIQAGLMDENELTEQSFDRFLWTHGMPAPDLIIRTGGYHRLSNFLLYQSAYSELYFLDCLWPDLQEHHLASALAQYQKVTRNFGT